MENLREGSFGGFAALAKQELASGSWQADCGAA
jgi:hypothetical protein